MNSTNKPDSNVVIIDYGLGNLFSIKRACETVGLSPIITSSKNDIAEAKAIILPGVGAFGNAMASLNKLDLVEIIQNICISDKPVIAICLGMQLLMSDSSEHGYYKGLNIVNGKVKRLDDQNGDIDCERLKVPHIGWSEIQFSKRTFETNDRYLISSTWPIHPFSDIRDGEHMYFVHSYIAAPTDSEITSSNTTFGVSSFCSSFIHKNIFACQFHPEKSGQAGLQIYKNFADTIAAREKEEIYE